MKRPLPTSWRAVVLAAPLLLCSSPARAQSDPAPPAPPPSDLPGTPEPATTPAPVQPAPVQPAPVSPPAVLVVAPPPAPPPSAMVAGPAFVPGPVAAAPAADHSTSVWYGWQTLIAIAPFDIVMLVGLAQPSASYGTAMFATGFVGRNVAPAVVHSAHGRPGLGVGSVGLHAAASATGLVVGYAIGLAIQADCPLRSPCRHGFRDLPPGLAYGAVIGSMVGTVLDVVILAHRPRASWEATRTASTTTFSLAPFATGKAEGVAMAGTF